VEVGRHFSVDTIRNVILAVSKVDRDVYWALWRMREWEDEYRELGREVDGFEEFYRVVVKKRLERVERELRKRGVDVREVRWERLARMIPRWFVEWVSGGFDEGAVSGDVVVYGESMGFVLKEGSVEWEVFEESDEPGELDMELYRKLVLGKRDGERIVLYGMHGRGFVMRWEEEGIPEGVYFAEEKWIAQRYWHEGGDDVLVKVRLPVDAVVPTADKEWKTVRWIRPGEFSLVVLG